MSNDPKAPDTEERADEELELDEENLSEEELDQVAGGAAFVKRGGRRYRVKRASLQSEKLRNAARVAPDIGPINPNSPAGGLDFGKGQVAAGCGCGGMPQDPVGGGC